MKARFGLIMAVLALTACNNHEKEQLDKLKALRAQDSTLAAQAKNKDSLISSYVNTMGAIQDNLDSLKQKEHILSMNSPENNKNPKNAILDDIKSIDNAIISNHKQINQLESKLRKMANNDSKMKEMIDRLTKEIAAKDAEIAALQSKLSGANDTINAITQRYNTSINEIRKDKAEISSLTAEMNTVYYSIGTMKQLKSKGAITKTGGFLGIGKQTELSPEIKMSAFTKGDKTKIEELDLKGKFSRLITTHPANSYKISKVDKKTEKLIITNASAFWSESKYLVVEIK